MPYVYPLSYPVFGAAVSGRSIAFLGKGLKSPLREDSVTGDFQRVSDEANVMQCVKDGVFTALGERVYRESLGTIARDMLFEESPVVADLLPPSIKDFVERFEPRVMLQSVTAKPKNTTEDLVEFVVRVVYVVRSTNQRRNLVFPYLLKQSESEA